MTKRIRFTLAAVLLALPIASTRAYAQGEFSGVWRPQMHEDAPDRGPGPELRDYLGLPINDSARQFAESWDPSRLTLPEEQCRVHGASYIYRTTAGLTNLRIWEEKDPKTQELVAFKHYISVYEQTRTIWMDGRPHPGPNALHTWMGFSTGRYEGDMLVVQTTHLKQAWLRRNGALYSDQATMTEYFVRYGDVLSHIVVLVDPVYLTEPFVRGVEFVRSPRQLPRANWMWLCESVVEIPDRPAGLVPAYLPGEHPFKNDFERQVGLPEIAVRGGAGTTYPEFQEVMSRAPMPPPLSAPAPAGAPAPARPGTAR